ncbi:5190_t:CDS:1, partial [Scutellospora calospora]
NNDRKSICWKYFERIKDPRDGIVAKCKIPGCSTRYVWHGSISNLLAHLKKHRKSKSSALTTSIQS